MSSESIVIDQLVIPPGVDYDSLYVYRDSFFQYYKSK